MKNKLIVLTGPTAAGKTDLSIRLAKRLDGEIISADSAQVYKGLDIGSAKVTEEEMQGVPHHLIDVYEPDFPFDVTIFQRDAKRIVNEIYERGHLPIIVGGTGFYIQALLYDISFDPEETEAGINPEKVYLMDVYERYKLEDSLPTERFSERLEKYIDKTNDTEALHKELEKIDIESAQLIHHHNARKVIRALEFYHYHGKPISLHNKQEREKESIYDSRYFVLTMDRAKLYDRINLRVDMMRDGGLLEEVKGLRKRLGLSANSGKKYNSMQAIGYKEINEALDIIERDGIPENSEAYIELINSAYEKIKLNTRHFAKRQLTWFRREKDVIWLDKDEHTEDELLEMICNSFN